MFLMSTKQALCIVLVVKVQFVVNAKLVVMIVKEKMEKEQLALVVLFGSIWVLCIVG